MTSVKQLEAKIYALDVEIRELTRTGEECFDKRKDGGGDAFIKVQDKALRLIDKRERLKEDLERLKIMRGVE